MSDLSEFLPELPDSAYDVWDDYYDGITLNAKGPYDRYEGLKLWNAEQMNEHGLACYQVGLDDAAYLIAQGVDLLKGSGDRDGDELVAFVRDRLNAAVDRQIAPATT